MAPFNLPWSTFSAYIVIFLSVLIAIIWAICDKRKEKGGGE